MNIKFAKRIALGISLTCFAVGFSDFGENMLVWMGRPLGAIAFIAFFIFTLLEKEYRLLDQQENDKFAALNIVTRTKPAKKRLSTRHQSAPMRAIASH